MRVKKSRKFALVLFFVILFLGTGLLKGATSGTCDIVSRNSCNPNNIVLGLSSSTNAHGELWNQNNYDPVLCCDFAGTHTCDGANKILGLFSGTNAHAEVPNEIFGECINTIDACLEYLTKEECPTNNCVWEGRYLGKRCNPASGMNSGECGFNTKSACVSAGCKWYSPYVERCFEKSSSSPCSNYITESACPSGSCVWRETSLTNYQTDVCYGNLNCMSAESCPTDYPIQMLSLSSSTNAHIGGFGDYNVKICCGSEEIPIRDLCGNGVIDVNEGETCDGANWGSITGCNKFDDFTGGTLKCYAPGTNAECHFDTSGCTPELLAGPCGNGELNRGETCDGNPSSYKHDWGSIKSCSDFDDFTGGTLKCYAPGTNAECHFDTTGCYKETPIPTGECKLISAEWDITQAIEGQEVQLIVKGKNCDGEVISFEVREHDFFAIGLPILSDIGSQKVTNNPQAVRFNGNTAKGKWTAEWQEDISGDPEYFFRATLDSTGKKIRSGVGDSELLHVIKAPICSGITLCMDYENQLFCEQDYCEKANYNVEKFEEPVGVDCETTHDCACWWDNTKPVGEKCAAKWSPKGDGDKERVCIPNVDDCWLAGGLCLNDCTCTPDISTPDGQGSCTYLNDFCTPNVDQCWRAGDLCDDKTCECYPGMLPSSTNLGSCYDPEPDRDCDETNECWLAGEGSHCLPNCRCESGYPPNRDGTCGDSGGKKVCTTNDKCWRAGDLCDDKTCECYPGMLPSLTNLGSCYDPEPDRDCDETNECWLVGGLCLNDCTCTSYISTPNGQGSCNYLNKVCDRTNECWLKGERGLCLENCKCKLGFKPNRRGYCESTGECQETETLCADGTCSSNCWDTDKGIYCDYDGTCESGEGCACKDCNREQDQCVSGLTCILEDKACCNSVSDGVCNEFFCMFIDPDCDGGGATTPCPQGPDPRDVCTGAVPIYNANEDICKSVFGIKNCVVPCPIGPAPDTIKKGLTVPVLNDDGNICKVVVGTNTEDDAPCPQGPDPSAMCENRFELVANENNIICKVVWGTKDCPVCPDKPTADDVCQGVEVEVLNTKGNVCRTVTGTYDCSGITCPDGPDVDAICNDEKAYVYNANNKICKVVVGTKDCVSGPECGNNIKETGEQCDDGNLVDGDGCSRDCKYEVLSPPCPESTTLCADDTCSFNCEFTDRGAPPCDYDGVCDDGESCACKDCNEQQDACLAGLKCSVLDVSCCNLVKDNFCNMRCFFVDPDCYPTPVPPWISDGITLPKPGTCFYSEGREGSCDDNTFFDYSWTGKWVWDTSNRYSNCPVDNPDSCTQSERGVWRYDSYDASVKLKESQKCEKNGGGRFSCPAKLQLPFFGFYNLLAVIGSIALAYGFLIRKSKNKKIKR